MLLRVLILTICFLVTSAYITTASKTEPVAIRQSLARLPLQIGKWNGRDGGEFNTKVVAMLGVDDYVNRSYFAEGGLASIYIGFYRSQRQGSAIHSPMNCLPGAGWHPAERSTITIPVVSGTGAQANREIEVNRVLIQKGDERQLVLYWYQSHGRIVSSEYWAKAYTVLDAIQSNRTDAALVRVISPISGVDPAAMTVAEGTATEFVQAMFPLLSLYLPD